MQSYRAHDRSDAPQDCGSFFIDVQGRFSPQDIVVRWCDNPRTSNDEVDYLIEQTWKSELARARSGRRKLFNGKLARLIDCDVHDDRLALWVGQTSYKEFLGTNLRNPHLGESHGSQVLADALGVSGVVVTGDGFLVMGRRSERVVFYSGFIHPISGMTDAPPEPGASPDPLEVIIKELTEETGISPDRITRSVCLALIRDKETLQPELIFELAVEGDVESIRKSARSAVDSDEHSELIEIRDEPAKVANFIKINYAELTPTGLAALLLHGRGNWGTDWFTATREYLMKGEKGI